MGYCDANIPIANIKKRKAPPFQRDLSLNTDSLLDSYIPERDRTSRLSRGRLRRLSIPVRTLLALTVRILLLLSGLLTATLLLTRLLSGFLVLLAGILVLI
jgi:hypothetical protein